jgi:hypothetical protein
LLSWSAGKLRTVWWVMWHVGRGTVRTGSQSNGILRFVAYFLKLSAPTHLA